MAWLASGKLAIGHAGKLISRMLHAVVCDALQNSREVYKPLLIHGLEALRSTYIHGDIQHGHLSEDFWVELHCSFKVLFDILLPNIFCNPGLQGTMKMQCLVTLTETCQKLPVLSWRHV